MPLDWLICLIREIRVIRGKIENLHTRSPATKTKKILEAERLV